MLCLQNCIFNFVLSVFFSFCQGYRHECRDTDQALRERNFEAMQKKVKRDRRKHNVAAEAARLGTNVAMEKSKEEKEKLAMGSGAIASDNDESDSGSDE